MGVVVDGKTKLTYEDYVLFPDDGLRHEIIDGEHYVSPAPNIYHQELSKRIEVQLYRHVDENGLGTVLHAPVDVELSETDIVEPDIIVIAEARRQKITTPTKVKGAPDLVIEILSESTGERDQTLKRDLYQRAGVAEYWIVDPEIREVTQQILVSGVYENRGRLSERVRCEVLPDITVDLSKVW